MVDFGEEDYFWWAERIIFGELDVEEEFAVVVGGARRAKDDGLPVVEVVLFDGMG